MEFTGEQLREMYWNHGCQEYRDHDSEGNRRVLYLGEYGTTLSPLSAVPIEVILRDLASSYKIPESTHTVDGQTYTVSSYRVCGMRLGEVTVTPQ